MAERNLAIRLSVLEGGKVKAELKEIGEAGEKSLKKIELAGQPASKSLLALNAAANDVKGAAAGLSSQMGPVGSALAAIGPAGLAAGAALAVVTMGLKSSLQEAAEAERSYNRLQAVLKATGNASGLTAREISAFADEMEATTLTTAEGVMDAAAVLATFHSVAGESFTRALSLAQDMTSVFGKDLSGAALMLGKALENPVEGLGALEKATGKFSDEEKNALQSMVETGQAAEAQKIIMDKLAGSVGGTGAAEATGLTGAAHQLSVAWKNMLEAIGETSAVAGTAQFSLESLAGMFRSLTGLFKDAPLDVQLAKAKAELLEQQQVLERLNNFKPTVMIDMPALLEKQKGKIAELRDEVDKLTAARQKQADTEAKEKAQAEAGRQAAEKQRIDELVSKQTKKIDDDLAKLVSTPSDKIAAINKELEKTVQIYEKLRAKDGSNAGAIEDGIKKAEERARKQIADVNKPQNEAAAREALSNAKVITDLERQLLGLKDARQAFIDQAVSRLSEKAGEGDKAKTRDLAGQLFDQKAFAEAEKIITDLSKQMDKLGDKRRAFVQDALGRLPETATQEQIDRTKQLAEALYDQGEAISKLDKLKQEGKQLTDSTASATEAYAEQVSRLNEMLAAGAITQEVYNRGKAKATDTLLENSKDPLSGAIRAIHKYREESEDAASAVEKAFTEAMKATEDAIVGMVTTGEFSLNKLNELANSVVEDITRMMVKKSVSGIFDWIGGALGDSGGGGGGFLDDIFGAIFHEGGKAGDSAPARQMPAYVFAGAPRYHSGGIAGLLPGEIPAILQRGEVVLPKNSRAPAPVTVVMNISTQDANSFRASQAQVAAEAARGIQRARRNL